MMSVRPSLPGGVSSVGSFRVFPMTVIVGLVVSVFTTKRILFRRTVSVQVLVTLGTGGAASRDAAHAGNSTGLVGVDVSCSTPPNPFEDVGSPEAEGISLAVMALLSVTYCFITRLT